MLQRPFPKLKTHHPTNLVYMLYPMVQSVWLVCVEKVKKMTLQWHCPLSSSFTIIENQNHFGAWAAPTK
jgi:hypothetical protein